MPTQRKRPTRLQKINEFKRAPPANRFRLPLFPTAPPPFFALYCSATMPPGIWVAALMRKGEPHGLSSMKLNPQDLEKITDLTLDSYNRHAEDFWEGTRNHDVSQNIAAMLQYIQGERPFAILDFGCGPGRDLMTFAELGHLGTGLEGAAHLAAMARAYSGCEVWQQDFLKLDLPDNYFDGVFANASLFHVPSQELPRVLRELRACLKPGGVLFSSNPRGHNQEGWSDGRFSAYHDLETWRRFVSSAGFTELTHYYRPAGLPPERQPWLASIWRR